ncbi:MAG: type I methionyl aminopeptidase [Chitinophagaceae bacterium]
MANYKTAEEIEVIRHSSLLVGEAIALVAAMIKPGVTTLQIDSRAEEFIRDNGGIPSFKNYNGFPFTACISVNDAVVHGFPSTRELKDKDVVSIDVGVFKNGFHGDSAYTFAIGEPGEDIIRLLKVTKESLYKGIEKAKAGNRTGDIGYAVQEHTERKNGYGVVRELVGHGLGRELHEEPQVPNYGKRGSGGKLKENMIIAIEPMINIGRKEVYHDTDGWTIRTKDGKPSAHFEHTICIKKDKADILSSFTLIEAAEKANECLCFVL